MRKCMKSTDYFYAGSVSVIVSLLEHIDQTSEVATI